MWKQRVSLSETRNVNREPARRVPRLPTLLSLMPDIRVGRDAFWNAFVTTVADMMNRDRAAFALTYNNDRTRYTARNIRPRTQLMCRGSDSILSRVVKKLEAQGHLPPGETSVERFMDLLYFSGSWWKGERTAWLAVEVESKWAELKGTLRDLLQCQSRIKVAIFYHDRPSESRPAVMDALTHVTRSFEAAGFREAPTTAYLVIVAPDSFPVSNASSNEFHAYSFDGLNGVADGSWLHETPWTPLMVDGRQ